MAKLTVRVSGDVIEPKEFVSFEYVTADEKKSAAWELLMELYVYVGSFVPQYPVSVDPDKDVR